MASSGPGTGDHSSVAFVTHLATVVRVLPQDAYQIATFVAFYSPPGQL